MNSVSLHPLVDLCVAVRKAKVAGPVMTVYDQVALINKECFTV